MTSMARRTFRATLAVTGMAALGAGFAGTAFAGEPNVQKSDSLQAASVDGFNTESVVPSDQVSKDVGNVLAPKPKAATSGPGDLTWIGQNTEPFQFSMEPTSVGTAGEEFTEPSGLSPMMTPMMEHAVPAVTQQNLRAAKSDNSELGKSNGLPEPANGPANDAAGPVSDSVMPATASTVGTVGDTTSNGDLGSNHEFTIP